MFIHFCRIYSIVQRNIENQKKRIFLFLCLTGADIFTLRAITDGVEWISAPSFMARSESLHQISWWRIECLHWFSSSRIVPKMFTNDSASGASLRRICCRRVNLCVVIHEAKSAAALGFMVQNHTNIRLSPRIFEEKKTEIIFFRNQDSRWCWSLKKNQAYNLMILSPERSI
jgi:hypothetical protein